MHRSFFALTIAALAGFATAVHAHDGAAPRSAVAFTHAGPSRGHVADIRGATHGQMRLAQLVGKGEVGQPCHAYYHDNEIRRGTYAIDDDGQQLVCKIGNDLIVCHPEDKDGPPNMPLCEDGYKN